MILFPEPKIYSDIEQGTDEWFDIRKGCVTSSRFSDVMAGGKGLTRMTYMREIAAEIITGVPMESFESYDMKRGKIMEPEARTLYEAVSGNEVSLVGFIKSAGNVGSSTDGLIDDDGILEVKTRKPTLQLQLLEDDEFPKANIKQVQGELWVTGRKWCDYISYWPGLPPWIFRVERDEAMIKEISTAVSTFLAELNLYVKKIENM